MKGSKGITPVIAIILLMMITIAMVGFTYVWMKRVFSSAANSTSSSLNEQQKAMGQKVTIIKASSSDGVLTIRNSGSYSIDTSPDKSKLAVFVNGDAVTCNWYKDKINPGDTNNCTITCSPGEEVDVNAPGGTDTATCE